MMAPHYGDQEGPEGQKCDRTTVAGASCLLQYRAKIVGFDVSWPASRAIHHVSISLVSKFPSFPEDPYHLNVFGGPPSLPRMIVIFFGSASSIYQANEVGHGSTEKGFVTVATFEHAHDSTLGPLVGKGTDILREAIEKRGWNLPIVPRH